MQFEGAILNENGVTFGLVVVKDQVLNDPDQTTAMQRFGFMAFGNIPIILMGVNAKGRIRYHGRPDIVNALTGKDISKLQLKRYSIE